MISHVRLTGELVGRGLKVIGVAIGVAFVVWALGQGFGPRSLITVGGDSYSVERIPQATQEVLEQKEEPDASDD